MKEGVFVLKKVVAVSLIWVMLISAAAAAEPGVSAASAVAIEVDSGRVLYAKDAETKRGMASTTKIMTAIVALERGKSDDIVTVSAHAANVEGSSMYLKEGEKITLENLIYGLMLVSGNDAATAIAEHIAGSEKKFAALMNKKAKEIGARNTHFTNPHGLADDNHYTTAHDLAKIAAYGLKNSVFAEIVATKSKTIEREGIGKAYLTNHNKLLRMYEGCVGVKTGFTKATGRCLVSSTVRDGMQIVCVTLNAGDDWNDHMNISNFALENYKKTLYAREGTVAATLKVKKGHTKELGGLFEEDIRLLEEKEGEWKLSCEVKKKITAPVEKGQVVGKVIAKSKAGEKLTFNIVAEKDILKKGEIKGVSFSENLANVLKNWAEVFG